VLAVAVVRCPELPGVIVAVVFGNEPVTAADEEVEVDQLVFQGDVSVS